MLFLKFILHINCFIKKIFYKIIYGSKVKFGKKVQFRKGFSLMIDKGAKIIIGDNTFFNNYCSITVLDKIVIGSNCLFGESVKIYDHNHIFNKKNSLVQQQGFKTNPIYIGNNCWFGSNSIILKNAKIGNNCVIGANEKINFELKDEVIINNGRSDKIRYE